MWIRRKDYNALLDMQVEHDLRVQLLQRCWKAEERLEQQARQLGEMTTALDWFRIRVNALERERAALLLAQGVQVAVPTMEPRREPLAPEAGLLDFTDIGDDEARKAGIATTDALETP